MTGRERIWNALGNGGAEMGVVICYQGIYCRDHIHRVTSRPWYDWHTGELGRRQAIAGDYIRSNGFDWFDLAHGPDRHAQAAVRVVVKGGRVLRVDASTGAEQEIFPPVVGGDCRLKPRPADLSRDEFDKLIGEDPAPEAYLKPFESGAADLPLALRAEFPGQYMMASLLTPLWHMATVAGFDRFMTLPYDDVEFLQYGSHRLLRRSIDALAGLARLGVDGIWLEECFTDMLSPDMFTRFNVPLVHELVEAIHAHGMQAIYYYAGNPTDRWSSIAASGADGFHFEEGKKGFRIDVVDAHEALGPRGGLFGNLDAYGVLEKGTDDDLRRELRRQIEVGRRRGGRFVVSIGSPVTPATPVERVRRYVDMARELIRG